MPVLLKKMRQLILIQVLIPLPALNDRRIRAASGVVRWDRMKWTYAVRVVKQGDIRE
jgi:hypothetical protein